MKEISQEYQKQAPMRWQVALILILLANFREVCRNVPLSKRKKEMQAVWEMFHCERKRFKGQVVKEIGLDRIGREEKGEKGMTAEKRKKRGKKRAVILLAGIAAACGIYGVWRIQAFADTDNGTAAAVAAADEEIIYGQLTAVRGNEITYVAAEETGNSTGSEETEEMTGEECSELIPVGTPVTTKLGTVTSFSRLAAGDNIAIVRNRATGEITAVYIIG